MRVVLALFLMLSLIGAARAETNSAPGPEATYVRAIQGELTKLGRMHPAGLRAFEQRTEDKSRIYAYENAPRTLPPELEKQFRANKKAWQWFNTQPPSYRRVTTFWVLSAKKEETRLKRLRTLIADSAHSRTIGPMMRTRAVSKR